MKRVLSVFLLAVLLLGFLPALAPPARMITFALVKVNRTSAHVGDRITWSVSNQIGSTLYQYAFTAVRGAYIYTTSGVQDERSFTITAGLPERYWAVVNVYDFVQTPNVINITGDDVTVTLRPAPKISKVEAIGGTSQKLSWSKVSGATGYEVWRSTSKTGIYTLVKKTAAAALTDTGLKAGQVYFYKVRTYNNVNGVPLVSGGFSAPAAGVPLAMSAITSAVGVSTSAVKLSWKKVTGATGYQILQSATPGGTYKSIKTTTALTYTAGGMQSKKTYYFKVRPYRKILTTTYYGPLSTYMAGKTK